MESTAYIKDIKISPKKLRFLLPSIKKLTPAKSLTYLFYTPKKGAMLFYKAIKSAITNAKQTFKIDEDLLKFKLLTVEEGRKLKRYQPGGKGAAKPIKKKYSHIKVVLYAEKPNKIEKTVASAKPAEENKANVIKSAVKVSKSKPKVIKTKKIK